MHTPNEPQPQADKTPEEFLQWVAKHVLDGDIVNDEDFYIEPEDEGTQYDLANDEAFDNYTSIVSEARRLTGKDMPTHSQ